MGTELITSIMLLIVNAILIYLFWSVEEEIKELKEKQKATEYKVKQVLNAQYAHSINSKDVKHVDQRCTNLWTRINQIVLYNRLKEKL